MLTIGLDVGGTKVLGVLLDPADPEHVLAEARVPTPEGGEGLVETLVTLIAALTPGPQAPDAIGVGVPGLVDQSGRLHMGPHLRHVQDLPLAALVSERSGVPSAVDNDANCHALAEQAAGAAMGIDEAVVVTLGTGIGAGIITGGRLLRGANGFAGEPGHMIVDLDGPPCPCGKRGCWEQLASGEALGRFAQEAAAAGRLRAVLAACGAEPAAIRGEDVTRAVRAGDAEAHVVLEQWSGWVALGLANLVNILDPAVVVLGGGLVDDADLYLPAVRARYEVLVMAGDQRPRLSIVAAALGGSAGAIGAAVLAAGQT
ncbi:MAG: ROK family protein [Microthrixaceae bacterium]